MLTTVTGVYHEGKIEFTEPLPMLPNDTRVIITFLGASGIDLHARGVTPAQAGQWRAAFATFAEEWESPEMDAYDDYDAAKTHLPTR